MDDTISAADIASWIQSQQSNTHQFNYQSCILNISLNVFDKNSGKPTPGTLHFNLIYSQIRKLVSPQATSSRILARGVKELKGAGIICRAKRFDSELRSRATSGPLGFLSQTQFPTRWSLQPKTLEKLQSIRAMILQADPLRSSEKVTESACEYFVQASKLAPLMFKMPNLRKSFGESKRLACLECLGNRASARRVSGMLHLERNLVLEKEPIANTEPSFPSRSRQSHTSQATPHSALINHLRSRFVTDRRRSAKRPSDLERNKQTFEVQLPLVKKRPASAPFGSRSQKRLRSLSSSSEDTSDTSTDGELVQNRLSPFLVPSSPAPNLRVPAAAGNLFASARQEFVSRNEDRAMLHIFSRESSPLTPCSSCESSLLSSPLTEIDQETHSIPARGNTEESHFQPDDSDMPDQFGTKESHFQPDDSDMSNQFDNQQVPNSPSSANNKSQEEEAMCASDDTRASSTEADLAQLMVKLIDSERPSSIMSSYLDASMAQSSVYKILYQVEQAMNKDHERIKRLGAELQQRHVSCAKLEHTLDAIDFSNKRNACREIIGMLGYFHNCIDILNVQMTQNSTIVQIRNALCSSDQNAIQKAVVAVKKVMQSCLALVKSQVDNVRTLGHMVGQKVISFGVPYLNASQEDKVQLGELSEASAVNGQLVLYQRGMTEKWQQLHQQILMLEAPKADLSNASSNGRLSLMRIHEEVEDTDGLIGSSSEGGGPWDQILSEEGQSLIGRVSVISQSLSSSHSGELDVEKEQLASEVKQLTRELKDQQQNYLRKKNQIMSILSSWESIP
ncbi:hypothetical protein PCANC_18091 [Puccinia coronata f. sp. avenae]|uniref:Uncharacterized protein n=1 Tax=Puccinia coronata f. sp. avenae TaxID=200324 RepID=A0A2N5SLL2_9BASI|nr:hypothetical protein PCANC_18091 [Puccinia coronata f. sp. avenae]